MSGPTQRDAPGAIDADAAEPPIEWSLNPWRRSPPLAMAPLLATAAILLYLLAADLPALAAIALALVFALSLGPVWLPARYRVDAQGVGRGLAGVWTLRRWDEIRRARVVPGRMPELFVSPQERPGPLDAFRALHLPLPREDRERARLVPELERRIVSHGLQR